MSGFVSIMSFFYFYPIGSNDPAPGRFWQVRTHQCYLCLINNTDMRNNMCDAFMYMNFSTPWSHFRTSYVALHRHATSHPSPPPPPPKVDPSHPLRLRVSRPSAPSFIRYTAFDDFHTLDLSFFDIFLRKLYFIY